MSRKRTAPWKDSQGRWRDPSGHFTAAPKRKSRPKSLPVGAPAGVLAARDETRAPKTRPTPRGETPALKENKKGPAKPAPSSRVSPSPGSEPPSRGLGRKRTIPPRAPAPPPPAPLHAPDLAAGQKGPEKPHARGWLAGWVPPPKKAQVKDKPEKRGPKRVKQPAKKPAPPAKIPQLPTEARKAEAKAKAEAAQVASVAAQVAEGAKAARKRLAAPKFQALHPEDVKKLERVVTKEEDAAEELRLHALEKQREWEKLFREAQEAERAATARRRAHARGQRVAELEALKAQKLTPHEMRKARGEVLGLSPGQAIGKPEEGKLTYTQLRHMQIVMREARHRAARQKEGEGGSWTKRGAMLREALYRKGLRSPEAMAEFFADVGMERNDGYVLWYGSGTS